MISAEDRAWVQGELAEIDTINKVMTNKMIALNSYFSKVLQKDNEERERKKVREKAEAEKGAALSTKNSNKGSTKKIIRKKPNDKKGKGKSSTPNKKGTKGR